MTSVTRITVNVNLEKVKAEVRKVYDKVEGANPGPVLYLKEPNNTKNFTFFSFMYYALMNLNIEINGEKCTREQASIMYDNLKRGLYSMVQDAYSFEVEDKQDKSRWLMKTHNVNSLIDNDYLLGDLIITLSSQTIVSFRKLFDENSPRFEAKMLWRTTDINDLFSFDNPNLKLNQLSVDYTLYTLDKVDVLDFNKRPGNFSTPIFNNDNSLDEYKMITKEYEHVVQSFSLHSASLFAASFDMKFNFEMNINRQITILPKGSIFFKVYGAFNEPFELAYTPFLFVLRSRYIRRNLRLVSIEPTQWYIIFEIANISDESVDFFDADNLADGDYRVLSFVVPSQTRMLMYTRIGQELLNLNSNFHLQEKWVFDMVEKYNSLYCVDVEFKSRLENILKEIFGVYSTIARVYRKEKPLDGSKRKNLEFSWQPFF
jgi:hypothetical protein